MASKLLSSDVYNIDFQADVDSFPIRENFATLKNKANEIIDTVNAASIGTTNAETTAARPYHTSLKERLDSITDNPNFIISGGAVTMNGVNQVDVTECWAKVGGIDVKAAATTSSVIGYTSSNTRYDVIVINSDATISRVIGSQSATPVLPAVATTQRPLAVLLITTTTVAVNNDARGQGVRYKKGGAVKWAWTLGGAISDKGNEAGDFYVGKGVYREAQITSGVTFYNNFYFEAGAIFYAATASSHILDFTIQKKIFGGRFIGGGSKYAIRLGGNDCGIDGAIITGGNATHCDLVLNSAVRGSFNLTCDHLDVITSNNMSIKVDKELTTVPSFLDSYNYRLEHGGSVRTHSFSGQEALSAVAGGADLVITGAAGSAQWTNSGVSLNLPTGQYLVTFTAQVSVTRPSGLATGRIRLNGLFQLAEFKFAEVASADPTIFPISWTGYLNMSLSLSTIIDIEIRTGDSLTTVTLANSAVPATLIAVRI